MPYVSKLATPCIAKKRYRFPVGYLSWVQTLCEYITLQKWDQVPLHGHLSCFLYVYFDLVSLVKS